MIKTLLAANKSERDKFSIPRTVQRSIPIKRIYSDGIWLVGNKHSRTWRFADINYEAASDEDRRSIFLSYCGVLNALPTDAAAKITICNHRLNSVDFQRTILMKERGDALDLYRRESNQITLDKMAQGNNLVQEKFITLSIPRRKIEASRTYFRRVETDLTKSFGRLDSGARAISNQDRLRILHGFFRPGEEPYFSFDQDRTIRSGMDFRDLICPDSMAFEAGHFEVGGRVGREHLCQFAVLRYQQEDGLNTVLPYGLRRIRALRTITNVALATDDDIIVIDAEREYSPLVQALGGEIIEISPHSRHHINPLDMGADYGDGENPIAMKSEVLMSIIEQQMGTGTLTGAQKSIIDRCTSNILRPYRKGGCQGPAPLLSDWRREVLNQPEEAAKETALASEIIVEGTLNVFAHPANVDMGSRIISIDLYEMGEQLRPTALVVTLEAIQNRVMENRKRGKYTWVFIDEVYLFFKYHYSAQFLYKAWKRFRKYAAPMTAATQNVEECLWSETARLMFANSEFLVLLNQAATDRAELAKLLHISATQMRYITNSAPGSGLIRMGGVIVPFVNTIPRDTALYRLMSTTPGEEGAPR